MARKEINSMTGVIIMNKDSKFIAFHNHGYSGSRGFVTEKITPVLSTNQPKEALLD